MADLFRVTFGFSGKKQGWSETIVFPAPAGTSSGAFYGSTILPIAQKRALMLAREYVLDTTRVSKIRLDDGTEVKRNVLLNSQVFAPASMAAANAGEQPNACVIARTIDITGNDQKDINLGGIPDEIAVNGGNYDGNGADGWGSRFNAWAQLVSAVPGGWLADKPNISDVPLTQYTIELNKTITFDFEAPIFNAPEVGTIRQVRMKGINGKSPLNGEHQVLVVNTSRATTLLPIAVFPYSHGGAGTSYIFPKPFVAGAIWGIRKIGTHKRGRPLGATRGRLPARARG